MTDLELLARLRHHAEQRPDMPAYISEKDTLTWRQLHHATQRAAAMFSAQMPAGATLVICNPNCPEVIVAILGALAAGLRAFPISPELSDEEILRAAKQSNCGGIVGLPRATAALRDMKFPRWTIQDIAAFDPHAELSPAPPRPAGDLLLQSSGTTGFPRIVSRNAKSLDAVASAIVQSVGFQPTDRVLAMLPLSHSYGIEHGLFASVYAGSTVLLGQGLDIERITRDLSDRATLFPTVPSVIEMLADLPGSAHAPSLRRIYSAGSPLPQTVFNRFQARYGLAVSQLYGATEVGSVTFNSPDSPDFDPLSVGEPMTGVSIRIVQPGDPSKSVATGCEGEVAIRADSMFSGYLDGAADLADGHFLTGDLGLLDPAGRLTITGRLKLLIDVGGIKVNPMEIESVLRNHPDVGACVVIPIRQSETVFRIKAVVTPRDPDHPPTTEHLRQFARQKLATYKVPRVFEMRSSLPVTATGKVLRHLVEAP